MQQQGRDVSFHKFGKFSVNKILLTPFVLFSDPKSVQDHGWAFQLLSVACLSLAAKMEEISVPPLLELQVIKLQPLFPTLGGSHPFLVFVSCNFSYAYGYFADQQ
jgi:hypothetical protein